MEGRTVTVGDYPCPVSEAEYILATMPNNTPIEWGGGEPPNEMFGGSAPSNGVGVLLYTWFYDGVVGEVQAGGRRVALWAAHSKSFWVRPLADLSRLEGPGMNGDGI